jgi:hypothetical protein
VQVLDHEHGGALAGESLQEASPGGECLRLAVAARLARRTQADQGPQVRSHPGRLRLVGDQVDDGLVKFAGGDLDRVGLQDVCLTLDDLSQRPQGDALPIGQAPALAPGDRVRCGRDLLGKLGDEPALANPRHPDHQRQF